MKVVISRPSSLEPLEPLYGAGHDVVILRQPTDYGRKPFTEGELMEHLKDAEVFVAGQDRMTYAIMESSGKLKLVIVPFIGTDKIDKAAATDLGVMVANSPTPENFLSVAEVTVGQMLNLVKQVKHKETMLRTGASIAGGVRGGFMFGKTVGIVGLGRIGKGVAARLANWDVELLAYDPYVPQDVADTVGVTMTDLDTLLAESDIVTIHAVATAERPGRPPLHLRPPGYDPLNRRHPARPRHPKNPHPLRTVVVASASLHKNAETRITQAISSHRLASPPLCVKIPRVSAPLR